MVVSGTMENNNNYNYNYKASSIDIRYDYAIEGITNSEYSHLSNRTPYVSLCVYLVCLIMWLHAHDASVPSHVCTCAVFFAYGFLKE